MQYNTKQKDKEYGRKQKWKDSVSGTRTKKIEPFARIGEEIEWNEILKTELLELKLRSKKHN